MSFRPRRAGALAAGLLTDAAAGTGRSAWSGLPRPARSDRARPGRLHAEHLVPEL